MKGVSKPIYDDKAQVKSSCNLGTKLNIFIFSFTCFKTHETLLTYGLVVYVSKYWGTARVTSQMKHLYSARLFFKAFRGFCVL